MPPLAQAPREEWTREVFGNISAQSKLLFYLAAGVAVAVFLYGAYRRLRLWRLGRNTGGRKASAREALAQLLRDVLAQSRVGGRGIASLGHVLLFWGFLILLIGTLLIAAEHLLASLAGRAADQPVFHKGIYYAIYEVTLEAFGLAMLLGIVLLAWRRVRRPPSLDHNLADWGILGALLFVGVTGYVTEALRILALPGAGDRFSFVGRALSLALSSGVTHEAASTVHWMSWWVHSAAALAVIALFPYTRLWHAIAGAVNLSQSRPRLGTMPLVTIEEVENTGRCGVGEISHFTRGQLLQLDACVSCGRCEEACPAFAAGKPLSPRDVVQDIRGHLERVGPALNRRNQEDSAAPPGDLEQLHGEVITAETLFSCTTCAACTDVCPLGVRPLDMITDLRQFLLAEGQFRGSAAVALQKMQGSGNPWGLPTQDRFAWANGLEVPTVQVNPGFEVLYWVGCAAAYDRRVQNVARSVVRLLQAASVNFAVLGPEERCTGESARRIGDEFLFQELAATNLQTLTQYGVRKLVTHCPHCLNSFRQDYPQLGSNIEVVHHSELLAELVAAGKLPRPTGQAELTYHDPCYLARVHDVVQPPRSLLLGPGQSIAEMGRRGRATACCGAGGGRMWMDDAPAERIGRDRVDEALSTGAQTVAVSCPFCLIMLRDGIAAREPGVEVRDIAELLADALENR